MGPAGPAGSYAAEDPPTAQLAAIRPEGPGAAPGPASYADPHSDPYADTYPEGDPSETMPLLLHGVGRVVDPAAEREPTGGRRRGMVVAAVAAVAVAGTAAFAAAVLGGTDASDDRASGLEVTTSASLNVAVSEAPSPSASSETPEPSSTPPSVRPTTTSASASPSATPTPTPSDSRTTPAPGATTGAAAPPAATATATPTTATPSTATTAPPTSQAPEETEEPTTTLDYGSTGPEVVELQERLTLAGAYHGSIDGEYSQEVWRAVKSYQSWMFIEGDPKGVYGPHTREALERSTWL